MGKCCSTCKKFQDYKNFNRTRKSKDGYKSQCKDCERAYRARSKSKIVFKTTRPKKKQSKEQMDRLFLIKAAAEKYKKPKDEFLDNPIEEDTIINEELVEIYDYEDLEYLLPKEQLH